MSNYPPGVTGNEWQIAGQDEFELEVTCHRPTVDVCYAAPVRQAVLDVWGWLWLVKSHVTNPDGDRNAVAQYTLTAYAALEDLFKLLPDITFELKRLCGFEGTVTAWGDRFVATWECPRCGLENEEEFVEDDVEFDERGDVG